jgi:hypothetical protein
MLMIAFPTKHWCFDSTHQHRQHFQAATLQPIEHAISNTTQIKICPNLFRLHDNAAGLLQLSEDLPQQIALLFLRRRLVMLASVVLTAVLTAMLLATMPTRVSRLRKRRRLRDSSAGQIDAAVVSIPLGRITSLRSLQRSKKANSLYPTRVLLCRLQPSATAAITQTRNTEPLTYSSPISRQTLSTLGFTFCTPPEE